MRVSGLVVICGAVSSRINHLTSVFSELRESFIPSETCALKDPSVGYYKSAETFPYSLGFPARL